MLDKGVTSGCGSGAPVEACAHSPGIVWSEVVDSVERRLLPGGLWHGDPVQLVPSQCSANG